MSYYLTALGAIFEPQLRKSNSKSMSKHHYKIEIHAFTISPVDEEEPKNR